MSHAWIKVRDAFTGKDLVYESVWYGFRVVPYVCVKKSSVAEFPIEVTCDELSWLQDRLGGDYDWRSLAAFVTRALKLWKLTAVPTPRTLFCSEALVRFRPKTFSDFPPERTTPGQLMAHLKKGE